MKYTNNRHDKIYYLGAHIIISHMLYLLPNLINAKDSMCQNLY